MAASNEQFYQSAKIKQNKNGKWRGILPYKKFTGNRNSDGSPEFRWAEVSKTFDTTSKAEARRLLAVWRKEMEERAQRDAKRGPVAVAAGRKPVPVYVDEFIEGLASSHLQPSSVKSYRTSAKFVREAFGGIAVEDLKPEQVKAWEQELIARGLSSSTVGKAHRLLKQAMKDAVNLRVIDFNPVDPVSPPKREKVEKGINSLDTEARTAVLAKLDALEHEPLTIAAYIALYMGLREGEICALQWGDADLDLGKLFVHRTIGEGPGGCYLREDATKTGTQRRLFMPDTLAAIMRDWKREQAVRFKEAGARLTPESFIIGDPVGFKNPRTLGREWTSLAKLMGVRGKAGRIPKFHDLRHTWADLFVNNRGDVMTAAMNLGHSKPSMTLDVYAVADEDAMRAAAKLTEVAMTRRPAEVIKFRNGTEG